ncbi:Spore germination protein GerD [Dirofilaria immitis]
MAAAFIVMISLLSIFNVTKECLPNANIIDEPYPFHAGETVEVMKSFENTMKRLLNVTSLMIEEVDEKNDTDKDITSGHICNISDITTQKTNDDKTPGRINDDAAAASINEVYQKNENDVKKQFEKCYTSKDCNELWKRIFGKCRCQWI